jgi:acyl-CoA synthetase (AMP-forming)/AMP-acid ligase II
MSRVRGRRSPITGALVVADIVVRAPAVFAAIEPEILAACRAVLPAFKVPAMLHEVAGLEIGESGKLVRTLA